MLLSSFIAPILLFLLAFIHLTFPLGIYIFPYKTNSLSIIITILTLVVTISAIVYMNTGNRFKR
ncbi:hypothetical protein [Clostridium isatidis]|uniref:Uncharacterized protein n=1 Tax=Clostridium isatidis TaxID=182773 RepID=A0A343JCW8_9CLOT|nr:hypothetical protein [Clostridium isatidis]ASW43376.1 hypothetical protein BEN51_07765 [Clostridium isatidis]